MTGREIMIYRLWPLGVVALLACTPAPSWQGNYRYEAEYGNTAGGTPVLVEYELALKDGGHCQLSINGFQTSEEIACQTAQEGNGLAIQFQSYAEGSAKAPHGVATYQAGEVLFTLDRREGKLITRWRSLHTLDLKRPKDGEMFVAKTQ